jgi:hypothetical protein
MSLPDHYLEARTKAGRLEVKRREGIREEQIDQLKILNKIIENLKTAKELDLTDTKVLAAEMYSSLNHIIKNLSEAQQSYDTFGESYSEGQQKKADLEKKRVALPDRC